MRGKSFYQFTLSHRHRIDEKGEFAEAMFEDLSFPKTETVYDALARYVEESGNDRLQSVIFDELYEEFLHYQQR